MKDFLKNVGATVVGLMLFSVIAGVIGRSYTIYNRQLGSRAETRRNNGRTE